MSDVRFIHGGPRPFLGRGRPPSDKSIAHRALILGALAEGETRVRACLDAEDTRATRACLAQLGARVRREGDDWYVRGPLPRGMSQRAELWCAESGTTARLLLGVAAGLARPVLLDGASGLRRRPMQRVARSLRALGAHIEGDRLPIRVGPAILSGGSSFVEVPSAQWKSALLLAGLFAEGTSRVEEAAPSRDHTERMLPEFGAVVRRTDRICEVEGGVRLRAATVPVPADPSSALYLGVAALVTGGTYLAEDVCVNETRTGAFEVLRAMGAQVRCGPITLLAGEPRAEVEFAPGDLRGVEVPPAMFPRLLDDIPVLTAAAALAKGRTEFAGIGELRAKESDRIATIARMLRAFGVAVEEGADWLRVEGGGALRPAVVDACGDHRIAMSAAVLALAAPGVSEIHGFGAAAKSYPGFAEALGDRTSAQADAGG